MSQSQNLPEKLRKRVLDFIRHEKLIQPGNKILAAVSGGADSVCLLHILWTLREKLGIELIAAHLDHMLRGDESDADARYVSNLSAKFNIPVISSRQDVKAYQKEKKISLEEAAREVRFRFLAETAGSVGASQIAVGHTADDHVETIIMHLLRGAGTRGLRGLLPNNNLIVNERIYQVIRPLLEISRSETEDYCRETGLNPVTDSTNLSRTFLRNRIRLDLIPDLETYSPNIKKILKRTSRIASDDIAFFESSASGIWEEVAVEKDDFIVISRIKLLELPLALRRYIVSIALEKTLGSLKDIEMHHIEDILGAVLKPAGKVIHLPRGLLFSTQYNSFILGFDQAALFPFPVIKEEQPLNVPGNTVIPGWNINIETANCFEAGNLEDGINRKFTAYFDAAKIGNNLTVRGRRTGDRFQPLGLSSEKKIGEFMIDARIPQSWRDRIPLVCASGKIIWVAGWRIDERVKAGEGVKSTLKIEFKPSSV